MDKIEEIKRIIATPLHERYNNSMSVNQGSFAIDDEISRRFHRLKEIIPNLIAEIDQSKKELRESQRSLYARTKWLEEAKNENQKLQRVVECAKRVDREMVLDVLQNIRCVD